MKYSDFTRVMTNARMNRYLSACNNNTRKAMTLYRKNLQLTGELFTIISCFEVVLRNAIDDTVSPSLGKDWLRDMASGGGAFDNTKCRLTRDIINDSIKKYTFIVTLNYWQSLGSDFGVSCLLKTNLTLPEEFYSRYSLLNRNLQQPYNTTIPIYLIS